jgi:acyl transferase domain-containing protein
MIQAIKFDSNNNHSYVNVIEQTSFKLKDVSIQISKVYFDYTSEFAGKADYLYEQINNLTDFVIATTLINAQEYKIFKEIAAKLSNKAVQND